jgi:hypothetical protein
MSFQIRAGKKGCHSESGCKPGEEPAPLRATLNDSNLPEPPAENRDGRSPAAPLPPHRTAGSSRALGAHRNDKISGLTGIALYAKGCRSRPS